MSKVLSFILVLLLFFVTVIVFIGCKKKQALNNINTDEVIINVSYVDESFFEKHDDYESFIQNEDSGRIVFTSNVPVNDFSWLSLTFEFDDIDGIIYDVEEELYFLVELNPKKPFVVSWQEVGIMSCFGFSYRDKDGEKKYFVGRVGNYGMDPEEYDGPAFVIQQFTPMTILSGQLYIIREDIPELLFREIGHIKDGEIFITELVIINSETKEVINRINLPDYTWSGDPPAAGDKLDIEFIDVNFDGYNDLKIFDCPGGNWRLHYLYFLWDKSKNMYVPDTQGLSDLGLPNFDEEKQLVFSMNRSSAVDHSYYTHKYINGVLTLIEDISETDVSFKDDVTEEQLASIVPILSKYPSYTFLYNVTNKLNYNNSKMETVESKYLLSVLNDDDWTIIGEYDAGSSIGKQLGNLVNWQ
jgi:hypothetical protein